MTRSSAPTRAAVRWGVSPARAFLLESDTTHVVDRARIVLRPWMVQEAEAQAPPVRSWRIHERDGAWEVWRDDARVATRATAALAVTAVEFQAVQALYDHPEVLAFHAALVARDGRGLLIFGPCESGKSTLGCALWQRGWSFYGDDTALVDMPTRTARPAPRRVSLRAASRALLGERLWTQASQSSASEATADGVLFHPADAGGRLVGNVHLAAAVCLARLGARPSASRPERLSGADAALALVPYSNRIRHADPWAAIAEVSPLAADLPCYDLPRQSPDAMTLAVDRILAEVC